ALRPVCCPCSLSLSLAVAPASILLAALSHWHGAHRDLPSFPTRRSSDLLACLAHQVTGVVAGDRGHGDRALDVGDGGGGEERGLDRKSTRLNSSHVKISYAVFCLKKKTTKSSITHRHIATRHVCAAGVTA